MLEVHVQSLRAVIVGSTGFAIGLALALAWRHFKAFRRGARTRIFDVMLLVGLSLAIFLVAEAVFRSPSVPFEIRTILYVASLFAISTGVVGITIAERREGR